MIQQWVVKVNGIPVKKSSFRIKNNEIIDVLENDFQKYVSRSAIKLKEFLLSSKLDLHWKKCLDIWASTGGFTQVMLENGAKQVFAIDVWTKQLHKRLKKNQRVLSIEKTDIRNFETEENFDFIVVDVSFISLRILLDKIFELAWETTEILLLYKPQFEIGRKNLNKKWVAKCSNIVRLNLENLIKEIENKWKTVAWMKKSSLEGKKGNLEWFIYIN